TATPDVDQSFVGWSGGGCGSSSTNSCTVKMTKNMTVTARFEVFTLRVQKTGPGHGRVTSSPVGIDCGTDCSKAYTKGTTVVLTATPDAGQSFSGWSGGGCGSSGTGTCTVSVNAN